MVGNGRLFSIPCCEMGAHFHQMLLQSDDSPLNLCSFWPFVLLFISLTPPEIMLLSLYCRYNKCMCVILWDQYLMCLDVLPRDVMNADLWKRSIKCLQWQIVIFKSEPANIFIFVGKATSLVECQRSCQLIFFESTEKLSNRGVSILHGASHLKIPFHCHKVYLLVLRETREKG